MPATTKELDLLSINTLRFLSIDAIQKANSGHPGMPMGCAPIAYSLYSHIMNHNPENPAWLNRDRFILSAGHGSALLYSALHLCGYDISLDQLKNFRQWGSITPGHPEFGRTKGVETTTGPLGQGFANAVGMALAEAHLAERFNKKDITLLDHFIYGICSDGDLMEGISHEAASIAGHLKLGKLIFFYDDNGISIDGSTKLAFSEDIAMRFASYSWHVQNLDDVNDIDRLLECVKNAKADYRPSLIITKSHIGYGSPNKHDSADSHGSPLGEEEVKLTKKNLGWDENKTFYVPDEVGALFAKIKPLGIKKENEWNKLFDEYKVKYPEDAALFTKIISGDLGEEWKTKLPVFEDEGKGVATRQASSKVLNAISAYLPALIGGSADLNPSTNTYLKEFKSISAELYSGRNIHYGIREHAMGSIINGMAYYGGTIPYGATFLVFADYMRPVFRLASISHLNSIFVFTHDSIGLGEDGPTHQPIEHIASLRAIPGLVVIRPADANETSYAWQAAIENKKNPTVLVFTRQGIPVLDQKKFPSAKNLLKGAYIIKDSSDKPDVILMASGSEVSITLAASVELGKENIKVRVVSFPSWELFEAQSEEYKNSVLPQDVKARVSIEAGVKQGWEKYTGSYGKSVSMETFGASAPAKVLMEKFGFTAANIASTAKSVLSNLK
jgi:transketolase